ncbi:hypothetical protein V8F33_000986 [Rhypophila sp. PSN 637]
MAQIEAMTMSTVDRSAIIRAQANKTWNILVTQFRIWNKEKIAAIDACDFRDIDDEAKALVLAEFSKFLGEPVSSVIHVEFNDMVVFGPKRVIESARFAGSFLLDFNRLDDDSVADARFELGETGEMIPVTPNVFDQLLSNNPPVQSTVQDTTPAKDNSDENYIAHYLGPDFLAQYQIDDGQQGTANRGPRRPPNPFILYRKDKATQVKEVYPNIHNNEISVMVGALWHNEIPEVRQAYNLAATLLKKRFLEMHPGYRYNPRRPSEIQRRVRNQAVLGRARPGRIPTQLRRRAQLASSIQMSSTDVPVPHSLPRDVENAIITQFPGVTNVHQGPVETTVIQDLPYFPTPVTTVIRNENLQSVVASHHDFHAAQLSQIHNETLPTAMSFNDMPMTFGTNEQPQNALETNWDYPQARLDDFFDFNAGN